jgi:hypothetical protein
MGDKPRNLLIPDKYWLGRSRYVRGRELQTWPDFVKGMSIALSSPEEIRYLAISVVRHEFQIKEKSGCNVF